MNHTLYTLDRPVNLAHRGFSARAPENTLAAFRLAEEAGADGIELDVKLSVDGRMVVIHDRTVDRTTNGHGWVGKLRFEELRRLDAGGRFSPEFAGEKIPTLEEVLDAVGPDFMVNVEVTNYASPWDDLPEQAARAVLAREMQNRVIFSSFNLKNLSRIRRLIPEAATAALAFPALLGAWTRSFPGTAIVHPYRSDVNPAYMARQQQAGRRVHPWTVNDPDEMRRLLALGAQGLITDDPIAARAAIKGMR